MNVVVERCENANESSREGKNGRIYTSTRTRVVWIVRVDGEIVEEFERKRDAVKRAERYQTRQIVTDAMKIDELAYQLDIVATDDKIQVSDMPDAAIVNEARHVLSLFREGGTSLSEMLDCDDASERRIAKEQVAALVKFLKKYKTTS